MERFAALRKRAYRLLPHCGGDVAGWCRCGGEVAAGAETSPSRTCTLGAEIVILRQIHIENLKLLRDFELELVNPDGTPRMWTVLIGENGTGKTSILQAIAMAAAGGTLVNTLARRVVAQLRDRRSADPMRVTAQFAFQKTPANAVRDYPFRKKETNGVGLTSTLRLLEGEFSIRGAAHYDDAKQARQQNPDEDPLVAARSRNLPLWFVAGYGVARALPDAGVQPRLEQASIDRLQTLFDSSVGLTSTVFANYFSSDKAKAQMFGRVLKRVLLRTERLVPNIQSIELRGRGGVTHAGTLQETARFTQRIGGDSVKLPATALSHGYQSTIAWIADLVGHIVLEAENELDSDEMQGLVLIDEMDLYLHPVWQVALVSALRETFPQLQFIATTHSPLITASLSADEIVALELDPDTGNVRRRANEQDPRVLTGTEVYRAYFGVDEINPDPSGQRLREYRYLAANPYRTAKDDKQLVQLKKLLLKEGIDPRFAPVPKRKGQP